MPRTRTQVLRALRQKPHSFWELLPLQDDHWVDLIKTLRQLEEEQLVVLEDGFFRLTLKGEAGAPLPLQPTTCPACRGKGVMPQHLFQETLEKMRRTVGSRPQPRQDLDQGYISLEDTVARVMVLYRHADLEGKSLLFLGDDDLTSLAAALTGLPSRITTLDLDTRLIGFLGQVAPDIEAHIYDVGHPLPVNLQGRFDVVCTDPVETVPGFSLFLSRAVEALAGPGSALYFGLTTLESNRVKWQYLQKLLLEAGFVITDILPGFHQYSLPRENFIMEEYLADNDQRLGEPEPETSWYTSSFYRVEAVGHLQPLVTGDVELGEKLYKEPLPE